MPWFPPTVRGGAFFLLLLAWIFPNLHGENPLQSDASFAAFDGWWEQYAEATDAARPGLISRGAALAARRRSDMLSLIESDPQTALQRAFPEEYHAALPESVQKFVEEHVRGLATLIVAPGENEPRQRTVEMNGQSWHAWLYGPRLQLGSRRELPLHGVVLEDRMAVDGSPLERFPHRESLVQALSQSGGKKICPICGKPGFIPAAAGDILLWFNSEEHVTICEKALIEKENSPQAAAE